MSEGGGPSMAAVVDELAELKRQLRANARKQEMEEEDDDDVPSHRRRHESKHSERGFLYHVLCCGCEPGCFMNCTMRSCNCCFYMFEYVAKAAFWIALIIFISLFVWK